MIGTSLGVIGCFSLLTLRFFFFSFHLCELDYKIHWFNLNKLNFTGELWSFSIWIFVFIFIFVCVCVYSCVCVVARVLGQWSEDNCCVSVLSFDHVGPRDQTQIFSLAAGTFTHWAPPTHTQLFMRVLGISIQDLTLAYSFSPSDIIYLNMFSATSAFSDPLNSNKSLFLQCYPKIPIRFTALYFSLLTMYSQIACPWAHQFFLLFTIDALY